MRTVPTLCASSAGIATSALGLSLVTDSHRNRSQRTPSSSQINTPNRDMSLTTTAIFTFSAAPKSSPSSLPSYSFATPEQHPRRSAAVTSAPPHHNNNNPRLFRSVSENAPRVLSNGIREPRVSLPTADRTIEVDGSPLHIPQRRTWLRKLSSSMSSSRESSRGPGSRPGSAAVSQSNGSVAYSNTGSTAPMFSSPNPLPPNKLVKRSSSIHDVRSSPSSRLPLPTFRRPATSHQRSSIQVERSGQTAHTTDDAVSDGSRDTPWKLYFTSKVAQDDLTSQRRRSSSIPNPIKRIYPDRRYRPTLVSGRELAVQGDVEHDDGFSSVEGSMVDLATDFGSSVASSPMLLTTNEFEQAPTAKRSFSIGDLLATGPQPLWRSTSNRVKAARRNRRRVSSTSQTDMGSMVSVAAADSERPTKRRGLVPPRSLYSSSSAITSQSGSTTPQEPHVEADHTTSRQSFDVFSNQSRSSSAEQRRVPSSNFSSQKGTRLSTTTSEITSGADSDSEYRSFGDTNTDYQSDTIFDSIPTRTTRSSSGRRGPPIDTIFDETPPNFSSGRSTKLKDFLSQDNFAGMENSNHRYSTIEEEESISTPVRSVRDKSIASSPTARAGARSIFSSSPPTMREMPDPDDIDWDATDDMGDVSAAFALHSITPQQRLPLRFAPVLQPSDSTPKRHSLLADKATIFDWSEAQPSPSNNRSPPRPRTVHGKKDPENRSSRPTTRRPVSGMHARSHSVPAVPDVDGKRANVANKFGTWGVGSKAVTEDWNEDFDFEESPTTPGDSAAAEKRIDSGHNFMVPRSIREQQQNVVANIGLLREWGLLIEELKELRIRAAANHMLDGPYARDWEEVDAMIELADQETEEHTLAPRRSPPSSPGFDYSAFEDPVPDLPPGMGLGPAVRLPEQSAPAPTITVEEPTVPATPNRPRKDSEAVARSVIEALRTRRSVSGPGTLQPVPTNKKVPFDTATLRHIVPYVNALKRKVKDVLRETEGLYKSPSAHRHAQPHESSDEEGFGDDDDGAQEA